MAAAGRGTDEPVAWYLHKRLNELLEQGVTQKEISARTGQPRSAVNMLVNRAQGAGPQSVADYVELLGFATRGQLVDAADAWWAKDGKAYAVRQMREMQRSRVDEIRRPRRLKQQARDRALQTKGKLRTADYEIDQEVIGGAVVQGSEKQELRRKRNKVG